MNYSENDLLYLNGELFSSGFKMKLENNRLWDRTSCILGAVKDKNVLHIGCCDHIPLIEKKIQNKQWMHGLLDENCKCAIGVDINKKAINYVNSRKFAKNTVYCTDVSQNGGLDMIPDMDYDFIVLGEILEHVNNPVLFLEGLSNNVKQLKCAKSVKYIITVPNVFSVQKRIIRQNIEFINSDHRYWFTPYTIAKVMICAGIVPKICLFASYGKGGNGSFGLTELLYNKLEKIRGVPSKIHSYRGDSLVVFGINKMVEVE